MNDNTIAQEKGTESDVITITREEGMRRINNPVTDDDQAFADDIIRNPTKYNVIDKAQEASPQGGDSTGGDQPAPQGGQGAGNTTSGEEVEIASLKIPKSLLGTYATGRSPQEALIEALKGNGEKDAVIAALKQSDQGGSSLKQRVEEYKRNRVQRPIVPDEIQFDVDDVNLEDVPMDESLYDPQNAAKMVAAVKKLADQNKALAAKLKESHETVRKAMSGTGSDESLTEKDTEVLSNAVLEDNFAQVDNLQKLDPKLKTSKSFRELDAEVADFWAKVARTAGKTAPEAAAMFADATSSEGQRLREQLKAANITPPADLEKHGTIMRVHQKREEYKSRLKKQLVALGAQREPHDWEIAESIPSFAKIYADEFVGPSRIMQAKIEGARDALAVKNPAGAAPIAREVSLESSGAPQMTLDSIDERRMAELLGRRTGKYTFDEANLVKQYFDKYMPGQSAPSDIQRIVNQGR